MITEDYVSFETAKLLKEKGFNKDAYTMYMYDKNGEAKDVLLLKVGEEPVLRPTLQMARKWLKEKHNLRIETRITNHSVSDMINLTRYYWIVFNPKTAQWVDESTVYNIVDFGTEEQAYEDAIRHCLEKLIQK